jgi:hypothetical protein
VKNFLLSLNPAAVVAAVLLAIFLVVTVAGCKSLPHETTIRVAVSYAVAKYIEKAGPTGQVERARRVLAVVEGVEGWLLGDRDVTVAELRAYVAGNVPTTLSAADRALAFTVIDVAVQALQERMGDGVLPPDQKVRVRAVLEWIRGGTASFLPSS